MREIHKDLEKKEFTDSEDVFKKGIGYYKEGTKPENILYSIPTEEAATSSASSTESAASSQAATPEAPSSAVEESISSTQSVISE